MSIDFSFYTQTGTQRLRRFGSELVAALAYPFHSVGSVLLATGFAAFTFFVLILLAQSMGVINLLLNTPELITVGYFEDIFMLNITTMYDKSGLTPIVMNAAYAVLTGIALTNMIAQLRILQFRSLANVGGVLPGLFAAGCASCGPGLFALFGVTGAVSLFPFQQTVLKIAGIGLFLVFLGFAGDPRECRID